MFFCRKLTHSGRRLKSGYERWLLALQVQVPLWVYRKETGNKMEQWKELAISLCYEVMLGKCFCMGKTSHVLLPVGEDANPSCLYHCWVHPSSPDVLLILVAETECNEKYIFTGPEVKRELPVVKSSRIESKPTGGFSARCKSMDVPM